MICSKCNAECQDGFTTCPECGTTLIENRKQALSEKGNWLTSFGKVTATKAISVLFFLGIIPVLISSISYGMRVAAGNKLLQYATQVGLDGQNFTTQVEVNNNSLGILGGLAAFVVSVLVWKIVCELLIMIFRCFETYVRKNKQGPGC